MEGVYRVTVGKDEAEADTEAAAFLALRVLVEETDDKDRASFPIMYYNNRFSAVLTLKAREIALEVLYGHK
jgi:hypothetical protein